MFKDKLIHSKDIEVRKSPIHRYGVFAKNDIKEGTIIEETPFLFLNTQDFSPEAVINDYTFDSGNTNIDILPLGCGGIYNHSDNENTTYFYHEKKEIMVIIANRDIKKDEEIFINYGSTWFQEREILEMIEDLKDKIYSKFENGKLSSDRIEKLLELLDE